MKSFLAKLWKSDNLFAPISLFCGIAAWTLLPFIGAVGAIFTGHIAYAKAKRLNVNGKGMALSGLILGYSGLAVVTIMVGIWLALPPDISLFGRHQSQATPAPTPPKPEFLHPKTANPQAIHLAQTAPMAEPIMNVRAQVEQNVRQGIPLNQINFVYELSTEQQRYWQRLEVQQGTLVATPTPDKNGMASQIMLLSVVNGKAIEWSCVGNLTGALEQAICH